MTGGSGNVTKDETRMKANPMEGRSHSLFRSKNFVRTAEPRECYQAQLVGMREIFYPVFQRLSRGIKMIEKAKECNGGGKETDGKNGEIKSPAGA